MVTDLIKVQNKMIGAFATYFLWYMEALPFKMVVWIMTNKKNLHL